jgi:uncharacterized protein (TIGR00255 family)
MIQSMTGYGKASGNSNNSVFEVEIKSVNSRFLDVSVRLPKTLLSNEIALRNLIKQKINRGKVSLNINLTKDGVDSGIQNIDRKNLSSAIDILNTIREEAKINVDIQLSDLLSFPYLFVSDSSELSESEFELIKKALFEAIEKLKKMRFAEGQELIKDLKKRIEKVSILNSEISTLGRSSIESYFSKLKERAAKLFEGLASNTDRLNLELALLVEKYDITEESVRLESHLKQFLDTLKNGNEAGKKLNFIVQEMNREANTISNKSVSLDITNKGLLIKEEIEKIREQIQNIE